MHAQVCGLALDEPPWLGNVFLYAARVIGWRVTDPKSGMIKPSPAAYNRGSDDVYIVSADELLRSGWEPTTIFLKTAVDKVCMRASLLASMAISSLLVFLQPWSYNRYAHDFHSIPPILYTHFT